LNIARNFLYCNHQVHRDFLITLHNMVKVRKTSIAKPLIQIMSKWSQTCAVCYRLNIHITKLDLYRNYIILNITTLLLLILTAIGFTPGDSSTVHIYIQTVHRLTPNGGSTVHIYTQTVQQYSTHLHTNSKAVHHTFTHKQYSSTVHIYTQRVQQYITHLHTNSTAVQYTFAHKQYSSTVQILTQTVQQYSTHLHTTVQQYSTHLHTNSTAVQ
jgi:hypothetical protein